MNIGTIAKRMVMKTPVDVRPGLDEWFEFEGRDVNVVGADYAEGAPVDGAVVYVFPCLVPCEGVLPDHESAFIVKGEDFEGIPD